jgi:DNA-binding MarR family transcriptional regulator
MSDDGKAMAKVTREAREATELLVEALHMQKRRFQTVAKEAGLSMQQAAAISYLEPGQAIAMSALAELLMCDASNVTGIVDKLEARGLARRGPGADRRVKVLELTEEGVAMRVAMREQLLTPPEWIAKLSRDDQRALADILRRAAELARTPKE